MLVPSAQASSSLFTEAIGVNVLEVTDAEGDETVIELGPARLQALGELSTDD